VKLFNYRLRRTILYEVFLIPALILFITFFIVPMFMSIYYSFTDLSLLKKDINFIGFGNYLKIFKDTEVISSIRNTLIFAFSSTIIINILGFMLAILLDKKYKIINLARMLIFAPAIISPLIVGYVWSYMLSSSENGLANSILIKLGLDSVNWLGNPDYALLCIIFIFVWQWSGWCMVIYLANLQTIPVELYEAAEIDGANEIQKTTHITLPLMVTSVTINSILFMIAGLKVYDIIIATTQGGPGYATESFTTVIVKKIFALSHYGYGSSIAVVLFIVIIVITLAMLKYLNKWEDKVS
jgi:raffinose/stachyose/melibiose transport system permease protein